MRRFTRFTLIALFLLSLSLTPSALAASTRYVSMTGSDSGDCTGSPCAKIAYAVSQSTSGDTINIATGTYTESGLDMSGKGTLTFIGAGTTSTFVQAAVSAGIATDRVFKFNTGNIVTLQDMTIRYGVSPSGGGINNNNGNLTLTNVALTDNQAKDVNATTGLNGGAISMNNGFLTINNSTISNNSVTTTDTSTSFGNGGALFVGSGGFVTINNSTISGNSAQKAGGALYIKNDTTNVYYSTIANNTSDSDSNGVGDGGGVIRVTSTINLKSSIVAGNKKGVSSPTDNDCSGTVTSLDYNLTGSSTGCSLSGSNDITVTPATVFTEVIDALADNGGATFTHALFAASPARDVIPSGTNDCGNSPFDRDQRGGARPSGTYCDIGAYEYQETTAPTVDSFTVPSSATSFNIPITAFTASDNIGVTGYQITESSTPPAEGGAGWAASAPATYTVSSAGSHTLYPWAKDAAGNVSAVYGSPASVSVCLSTVTVTSNADSGAGTLRQAINDACQGASIDFNASLSGSTIHLASTLTLSKDVIIDGSSLASQIAISGDTDSNTVGDVRVLSVDPGVTATLDSLTITQGYANEAGAIFNEGNLTITNSTISYNASTGYSGAISSNGSLTITDSTFLSNTALGNNQGAGAILNNGDLTITGSTFSSNTATVGDSAGGAIYNTDPDTMISNSTFSGNSAGRGGAIYTTTSMAITNSTFSGNSANNTGGLYIDGGTTNLENTIIANSTGGDCANTTIGLGTNINNLIEDGSCYPLLSVDPKLGALADNGGSTQTIVLLAGSPAIDAGDDVTCYAAPVNNLDQRGTTRPNGAHCDIGAYEYVDASAPTVVSSMRATAGPTNAASVDFVVTFSEGVSGVDTSDFSLVAGAGLTGASVTSVSSGTTLYTVTVNTGSGSGTLRLDVHDNDSITDGAGNKLGGTGTANGDFTSGESYTIDKTAPTVSSLVADNITIGGGTTYTFSVTFSDNLAIDSTSLGDSDLRVTGPGGFNQLATFVSVAPGVSGTPRTATYRITAPGGTWDTADSGTYTVAVEPNQIFDSAGNSMSATSVGSFLVSLKYTTYLPLVRS